MPVGCHHSNQWQSEDWNWAIYPRLTSNSWFSCYSFPGAEKHMLLYPTSRETDWKSLVKQIFFLLWMSDSHFCSHWKFSFSLLFLLCLSLPIPCPYHGVNFFPAFYVSIWHLNSRSQVYTCSATNLPTVPFLQPPFNLFEYLPFPCPV